MIFTHITNAMPVYDVHVQCIYIPVQFGVEGGQMVGLQLALSAICQLAEEEPSKRYLDEKVFI